MKTVNYKFLYVISLTMLLFLCSRLRAQELARYVETMAGTGSAITKAELKHAKGDALNANTIPIIKLPNGKHFENSCKNKSLKNSFIGSVSLNGKAFVNNYITYEQITSGGKLEIVLQDTPGKNWAVCSENQPK